MFGLHRFDASLTHIALPPGPGISRPWGHPHGVYVLHGESPALIDTGFAGSSAALVSALGEVGLRPEDIRRVLLTGHGPRQTGNLALFPHAGVFAQEALAGAPSPRAYAASEARAAVATARALVAALGEVPGWDLEEVERFEALWCQGAPRQLDAAPLHDGMRIRAGGRELEVIATPGVGPGATAFVDGERGWIFAGLAMSFREMPPFDDIDAYTDTLAKLTQLRPAAILPAWGPIETHHAVAFRSLSLQVNNLLSNIQYVIRGRKTAADVVLADMGYVPRDLMRFAGTVRRHQAVLDGLAEAGIVGREGDDALPVYILESARPG